MKKLERPNPGLVYQRCKDHTVSGDFFDLLLDEESDMLITHPMPQKSRLPHYYKSEDYISHTDADATFFEKIYQRVKRYMLQKKLLWLEKKMPNKGSLLDIGAGTGDFLLEAKKRGWHVNGVEPNPKARELSRKKGVEIAADTSEFSSNEFDVITLWHVLEHVYDLKAQIIELEHLLKKGGLLIIAVPNYKSYDAEYYKEFWAAYDVPRHLWHFSQNSFRSLINGTGFKQTDSKPLIFDAYYVSLLSEKYKNNKTNFLRALYIGFKSNFKARYSTEYSSIAYFFRKRT